MLIARPVRADAGDLLLVLLDKTPMPRGATPAWISEPVARLYGWSAGTDMALPIGGRTMSFRVAGVWRDYARQQGAVVIRNTDYVRLTGDRLPDEPAITLAPGADAAAVRRAVTAALPAGVSVAEPATSRRFALRLFDRSFAITYVLEAVAILVGLAGVTATVSAQTIVRNKEFGMLRHLRFTRRQITEMLANEGASRIDRRGGGRGARRAARAGADPRHQPQSFNWTIITRWPVGTIFGVMAALVGAAGVTALLAGRRATAAHAVAVREDWRCGRLSPRLRPPGSRPPRRTPSCGPASASSFRPIMARIPHSHQMMVRHRLTERSQWARPRLSDHLSA